MPEVDRAKILRVLAQQGMEWPEWHCLELYVAISTKAPYFYITPTDQLWVSRGEEGYEKWSPDTDWRAAGELLEAMRSKPEEVFRRFGDCLISKTGVNWIQNLAPKHIADAAYEALEASRERG